MPETKPPHAATDVDALLDEAERAYATLRLAGDRRPDVMRAGLDRIEAGLSAAPAASAVDVFRRVLETERALLEGAGTKADASSAAALAALRDTRRMPLRLVVRVQRAQVLFKLNRHAEAEAVLRAAHEEACAHDDPDWKARIAANLGVAIASQGRAGEALPFFLEARGVFVRTRAPRDEGMLHINLANAYLHLGSPEAAIREYRRGAQLAREAAARPFELGCLSGAAYAYLLAGEAEAARGYAEEAAEGWADLGDTAEEAQALDIVARARSVLGHHEEALEAAHRSVALRRSLGREELTLRSLSSLAKVLLRANDVAGAARALDEAAAFAGAPTAARERTAWLMARGDLHLHRGEWDDAVAVLEECADRLEALEDPIGEIEARRRLATAHEEAGDPAAALRHLRRSLALDAEVVRRDAAYRRLAERAGHDAARERDRLLGESTRLTQHLLRAQEDERRRLSRELHDGLSQEIAMLGVEVDLLAQDPPRAPEALAERLRAVADGLRALGADVHRLSRALQPAALDRLGLEPALRAFAEDLQRRHGFAVTLACSGPRRRLPPEVEHCLFRVAQEALVNARRHGGVDRATLRLRQDPATATLEVVDEGAGFDAAAAEGRGLGLAGMRERMHLVSGQLGVSSTPGRGTRVRASVPLPPEPSPSP